MHKISVSVQNWLSMIDLCVNLPFLHWIAIMLLSKVMWYEVSHLIEMKLHTHCHQLLCHHHILGSESVSLLCVCCNVGVSSYSEIISPSVCVSVHTPLSHLDYRYHRSTHYDITQTCTCVGMLEYWDDGIKYVWISDLVQSLIKSCCCLVHIL